MKYPNLCLFRLDLSGLLVDEILEASLLSLMLRLQQSGCACLEIACSSIKSLL